MQPRRLAPLALVVLALAGCAGGASAPPAPEESAGPAPGAAAGAAWTTDLLAATCVEHTTTASPENAAHYLDQEVHWNRARSGERPDGLRAVEVPYSESGGEFAGAEGSFYCAIGGTTDAPDLAEWGQAVPFSDDEFASFVGGEWAGSAEPER
ncbi:hypothetical protein [Naasia sp. SYSU D00057]|uniref:hypothetical protein n=1 Tax=Naasia sp. SYSU D00057 TaxID=2817380 RepID=UPI001B304C76|nr:hypothetical protein [Naasia sp. SYSU D00057]